MRRTTIALAAALVLAVPLTAVAQGWGQGPGGGPGRGGRGLGPCAQAGDPQSCLRVQNPTKHAACWTQANAKALWGPARQSFMLECMTK